MDGGEAYSSLRSGALPLSFSLTIFLLLTSSYISQTKNLSISKWLAMKNVLIFLSNSF